MKEIVTKLEEEQKDTLKEWAKGIDKPVKELLDDFCEQYTREDVQNVPEKERVKWALKVVDTHIANELSQPTEWIEVYVTGLDANHGVENRPGNVYGIGAINDVKEPKEIIINAWRETKKFIDELATGKAYKIKVSRQSNITDRVEYNFQPQSRIEESNFLEEADTQEVKRLIQRFYERTLIRDAERNLSKRNDYTDFKMIHGMVQRHMIKPRDDGGSTCMLFMRDGSIPHQDIEPNSAMTVFVPPEMMEYGTYSELMIIGRITQNKDSDKGYGPSMNAVGIIPLIPTPLDADPTSVSEDTIEVEDADDVIIADEDVEEDYNELF